MNIAVGQGQLVQAQQQLRAAQSALADMQHSDGIGDFFGDWQARVGGFLHGSLKVGMGGRLMSDAA